jgi:hypothetical protein
MLKYKNEKWLIYFAHTYRTVAVRLEESLLRFEMP